MSRPALAIAAVLALGLSGCAHGSSHKQSAPPPRYPPQMVQRAFARVGIPLTRDREQETLENMSGEHPSPFRAFLINATGNVKVTVYPQVQRLSIVLVEVGKEPPVTRTQGNVEVTYPRRSRQAPRVRRALALLSQQG